MENYNIVILNWNGWKDTKQCVESIIRESSSHNYTLILVDNGSEQKEINLIEEYCNTNFEMTISQSKEYFLNKSLSLPPEFYQIPSSRRIIFIKNNENLGFACGNNVALEFLRSQNQNYAILLNNDTEIEGDALGKMFRYLRQHESEGVAAVIPQIRYYKPKNVIWNCGGHINWLGLRKYHYAFSDISEVPQTGEARVDYGTGCALLINLQKTGILSDRFFLGEEDMELAFRLKNKNLAVYCIYDAVIYHKVGASRGRISEEKMGNMVYHYSMRMSNLKDHLSLPVWYMSFLAHYLSTIRILYKQNMFSLKKVNAMWRDIYHNVRTLTKYTRQDFIRIANKRY
ncbi:glycosyltransferase [Elizabethkingia argentiflava]|uniref:Glycosyltransferase n=1 Tax=Elizabethkingia argenteiflava TaxID=2681556 RepID=A0A845PWL9_9FLAO|nr:glycosyltransferase family 2 protein [Elizabethkingia argenteiflava]NAW51361.1 glycosyltransferase [Elizabethkingia argenteiflava]